MRTSREFVLQYLSSLQQLKIEDQKCQKKTKDVSSIFLKINLCLWFYINIENDSNNRVKHLCIKMVLKNDIKDYVCAALGTEKPPY